MDIVFSDKELELIASMQEDSRCARTQVNMKRLNRIMNKKTGKVREYCLCSDIERAVFHRTFYDWFNGLKTIEG